MKNTLIAHLKNYIQDSVDVFITFILENVETLRIPLGQLSVVGMQVSLIRHKCK